MIIVNFKSYSLSYFDKVFNAIKELKKEYNFPLYLAVPHPFLYLAKENNFILAQDYFYKEGAFTGKVTYEMLKFFSVKGSLLNHSENQKNFNELIKCLEIKEKDFLTVVCADSKESALALHYYNEKTKKINFIAYEPPELIGTNVSVSKAKPEIIKDLTKEIDNLLVGAGIKTKEDVKKAIELGAKGVLVASGIVKNKNPKKVLEEWINIIEK
ncbi:MAG: triose-phosphate isomerase [Nanoarchaeota archaeon]